MAVFGKSGFYSVKSGCIRVKWLNSRISCYFRAEVVVFGQNGCDRINVFLFRQKWLYSSKSGCIRAKVVVFGRKWLLSGKNGCIRAKVVAFGQKLLY